MAQGIHLSKTLIAANAALIAASQTPGAAGALTLTGTTVVLDTQRRVIITSAGNNSGVSFTITGLNDGGLTRYETIAGANVGISVSLYDYRTITSVSISGASTGALTVGTNTTGSTDWKLVDGYAPNFNQTVSCWINGSATYSIETTNSAFLGQPLTNPANINVVPTTVAAATIAAVWAPVSIVHAWRLTVTAGTGTAFADSVQTKVN